MSDPFTLTIVQGERLRLRFRWESAAGQPAALPGALRSQVRRYASRTSDLLLDLTPHLTPVVGSVGVVDLDVPGIVTGAVPSATSARWDIFCGDIQWTHGPAVIEPSPTA